MPANPTTGYASLDKSEVLAALFHPRRSTGRIEPGSRCREIRIPVDGGIRIGARAHMAHAQGPCILFFHGNGE
ncbi:MAG TPA: alpha/beta hydrolase, partial [Desulfosarcina sp.]|nr:alpha/beta hydrolase [Desulfosarcina sp.]